MPASELAVERRLDTIAQLGLLARVGDPALSGITRVTAYVTGAGAAAVHILDAEHQRRVAAHEAPLGDHPTEDSMCRLVVDSEQRIVCADASRDPRFGYSSFVHSPSPVRFYASVPLRTSDEVVVGTLCAFDTTAHDISGEQIALLEDLATQVVSIIELKQIARDLGHAACHDALTGAVNRLVLTDRLSQAFARRMRNGGETFVALCDIDDFKRINDIHGHTAGDQVLVEVAARLRRALRPHDTVARVGGDEFVVVAELPGHAEIDLGARLESALAAPIRYEGAERPVQVSIGCVLAEPGEEVRDVLHRADAAMYREKSAA